MFILFTLPASPWCRAAATAPHPGNARRWCILNWLLDGGGRYRRNGFLLRRVAAGNAMAASLCAPVPGTISRLNPKCIWDEFDKRAAKVEHRRSPVRVLTCGGARRTFRIRHHSGITVKTDPPGHMRGLPFMWIVSGLLTYQAEHFLWAMDCHKVIRGTGLVRYRPKMASGPRPSAISEFRHLATKCAVTARSNPWRRYPGYRCP